LLKIRTPTKKLKTDCNNAQGKWMDRGKDSDYDLLWKEKN
jgi:hypothetical protein